METEKEIKVVDKLVRKFLQEDERCRNDDKWLTYRVMKEFSPSMYIPFEDFVKLPAFETVKRCRAKIQNDKHLFLPTSAEVRKKRHIREDVFRESFIKDERQKSLW